MALIWVKSDKGEPVLVHSSVFDTHRKPEPKNSWVDVWKKVDKK